MVHFVIKQKLVKQLYSKQDVKKIINKLNEPHLFIELWFIGFTLPNFNQLIEEFNQNLFLKYLMNINFYIFLSGNIDMF